MAISSDCLVPVCEVGGCCTDFAFARAWTVTTVFTVTGPIPIARRPASVTPSVVPIGIDLLQPARFDHLGDGHLCRRTGQTLGQRGNGTAAAGGEPVGLQCGSMASCSIW
jgi:hypothetical protein